MSVGLTSMRAVWVVCFFTRALGLLAVQEEADRHQQEDAQPEDEAALPLQAGFTEQVFEAAIGHGSRSSTWLPTRRCPRFGRLDADGHPLPAKASAYTIVLEGLFTLLENGPDGQTEPKDARPPSSPVRV